MLQADCSLFLEKYSQVSHLKERIDKDCLNCGAQVEGRYCHICGQENTEPHESFWALIQHFIFDLFHFDGKFFESLKYLLFRPGFLTKEYMRGRRLAYLNPIRMYIFTSAIFFLIIFSFFTKSFSESFEEGRKKELSVQQAQTALLKEKDLVKIDSLKRLIATADSSLQELRDAGFIASDDSVKVQTPQKDSLRQNKPRVRTTNDIPKSVAAYDSLQNLLPESQRDDFFRRYIQRKTAALSEKYNGRQLEMWEKVVDKSIHSLPSMMMISLPFFAFLLFMLYVRNPKWFFVDHLIFTLHLYIAQYINLLVLLTLGTLRDMTGWSIFSWIFGLQAVLIFYYLYKCMRNFYGQSRRKTILKYSLLNFSLLIIFTFLFLLMVVNSLLSI